MSSSVFIQIPHLLAFSASHRPFLHSSQFGKADKKNQIEDKYQKKQGSPKISEIISAINP